MDATTQISKWARRRLAMEVIMKRMNKHLSILVLFALMAPSFSACNLSMTFGDEFMNTIVKASKSGKTICSDFLGEIWYDNNGNMVLQVVKKYIDNDPKLRNRVKAFADENKHIILEYVDFSCNELNAAMDDLNALFLADERPDAFENVRSFGVDAINNRIEINLIFYNDEEIARFQKTVLDLPVIVFKEASIEPYIDYGSNDESTMND
jgi:hypothetical protein